MLHLSSTWQLFQISLKLTFSSFETNKKKCQLFYYFLKQYFLSIIYFQSNFTVTIFNALLHYSRFSHFYFSQGEWILLPFKEPKRQKEKRGTQSVQCHTHTHSSITWRDPFVHTSPNKTQIPTLLQVIIPTPFQAFSLLEWLIEMAVGDHTYQFLYSRCCFSSTCLDYFLGQRGFFPSYSFHFFPNQQQPPFPLVLVRLSFRLTSFAIFLLLLHLLAYIFSCTHFTRQFAFKLPLLPQNQHLIQLGISIHFIKLCLSFLYL